MKTLTRKQPRLLIYVLFIGILMGKPLLVLAQKPADSVVRTQIAQIGQQVKSVQTERDRLLRKNRTLTDKINATKQKLQKGGNPLVELQLQNDLKASRELADQIQALDKQIYGLTGQSVAKKQQLLGALNADIEKLSQEANAARNTKQRERQLKRILALQKEKETYQAQITDESNELLLGLDVTLAETDGPDEILQKIAIVQDQRDIIHTKVLRMEKQIQETQKRLGLQQNMLELLRNIGRGEEDEFDFDRSLRIAESQEAIADIEATLEITGAKKEILHAQEKALAEKAERFSEEAAKLAQPSTKGDSSDSK